MKHKCDGCRYKGEHHEMMFASMGVCTRETNLIEAEKAYKAEKCPYEKSHADVVEVKHGEWKKRGNEKKCSRCEFIYYSNNDEWSFCPNCGAKMDGERKEQG